MVNGCRWKGRAAYECEACGFGYADLETAKRCEEFCDVHGRRALEITKQAVYKPLVQVMSIEA